MLLNEMVTLVYKDVRNYLIGMLGFDCDDYLNAAWETLNNIFHKIIVKNKKMGNKITGMKLQRNYYESENYNGDVCVYYTVFLQLNDGRKMYDVEYFGIDIDDFALYYIDDMIEYLYNDIRM